MPTIELQKRLKAYLDELTVVLYTNSGKRYLKSIHHWWGLSSELCPVLNTILQARQIEEYGREI